MGLSISAKVNRDWETGMPDEPCQYHLIRLDLSVMPNEMALLYSLRRLSLLVDWDVVPTEYNAKGI